MLRILTAGHGHPLLKGENVSAGHRETLRRRQNSAKGYSRGHACKPRQHRLGFGAALGALDEAAAEHAGLVAVVGIEHAGLAGRDAGFAVAQFDPGRAVAMVQDGRARRPGRADLGEEFQPVGRDGIERAVAQPVDVAQDRSGAVSSASRGPTMTRARSASRWTT